MKFLKNTAINCTIRWRNSDSRCILKTEGHKVVNRIRYKTYTNSLMQKFYVFIWFFRELQGRKKLFSKKRQIMKTWAVQWKLRLKILYAKRGVRLAINKNIKLANFGRKENVVSILELSCSPMRSALKWSAKTEYMKEEGRCYLIPFGIRHTFYFYGMSWRQFEGVFDLYNDL